MPAELCTTRAVRASGTLSMQTSASRPIHADYNATTPVDPRVVEQTGPYLNENFGKPAL